MATSVQPCEYSAMDGNLGGKSLPWSDVTWVDAYSPMRRRRQRRYWIPVAVGKEETLVQANQHTETLISLK